jgi:hypothetical protein
MLAALAVVALGTSCMPRPNVEPGGFLGDYEDFTRAGDGSQRLVYVRSDVDLRRFDRLIIEPVEVVLSEDSLGSPIDPAELAELARYLYTALQVSLRDVYTLVEEPGPTTLRLRAGITDVVATRPGWNTAGTLFVPLRAASAVKRVITGTDLFVGQAAIEAELVDSVSGQRLRAVVDRKAGDKFTLREGTTPWGHVEKAFRQWAFEFRTQLLAGQQAAAL